MTVDVDWKQSSSRGIQMPEPTIPNFRFNDRITLILLVCLVLRRTIYAPQRAHLPLPDEVVGPDNPTGDLLLTRICRWRVQ